MLKLPTIFIAMVDIVILSLVWIVAVSTVIIPLSPIWLTMLAIRSFETSIYNFLYNATIFNWEEVMWMDDLPKNKSIINCILLLKKGISIEEFRNIVLTRMINVKNKNGQRIYPRITQYICSGFINDYWVDEKKFDIGQHVYEWSNIIYDSIEDLQNEMYVISTSTMCNNNRISPWELLLLHYNENMETKSAIIFRSHHSLADGASFVYLLLNQISDEKSKHVTPRRHSIESNLFTSLKSFIYVPLLSVIQLMLPTPSHDLHCVAVSEKKTVAWSEPISLPLVKSIKERLGVSVNDILVGCFATNIHNFFKENEKIIPSEIMTSFSVNANDNIDEAITFKNKFAVISIPIPTASGDVLKNVVDISQRMDNIKTYNVPNSYRAGFCVYDYCLPRFISKMVRNFIAKKSSMVLSNVPGPQVPVKIGGIDVDMICFWPPQKDNIGMACSIFSYTDTIMVGFSCDKALNIKPFNILEGLPSVLKDLANRVGLSQDENDEDYEDYEDYEDDEDDEDDEG